MTKSEMVAAFTLDGEAPKFGVHRIADLLHITPQAVYRWPERLNGPRLFAVQCAVEVLTEGRLRAEPDDLISADDARESRHAAQKAQLNVAALDARESRHAAKNAKNAKNAKREARESQGLGA